MKNLLKWELKQTFQRKAFWGIGIALLLCTVLLLPFSEDGYTGFDLFLLACNDFNSLMILLIGIYAGIHVTGAFESRKIQAAIMAGNSRFKVLSAKLFSFSLSIALFCIFALSVSTAVIFAVKGFGDMGGNFFREVILRMAVFTLAEVSFAGICFFLSMLMKNLGSSIAVNFISMLALHSLMQYLVSKEWAYELMKFTAPGQSFILLSDAGTGNLLIASAASLIGLAFIAAVSFMKFRKEELK